MITQAKAAERASRARAFDVAALLRAYPWALLITALVLLGALLGPAPLSDPASGAVPTGARVEVGWGYVLMAPVAGVLDALSVLTLPQHYAMLVTLFAVFIAWRALRRRTRRGWARRAGIEGGVALLALLGLLAFYAYGIVGPRPMGALVLSDPDIVVVDFHSHTHHSHDGRRGFDAERNREWHASAGFDVAYVSDHRTFQGFEEAAPRNPARAGAGTVLLSALEIKFADKYASVLGAAWRYRHAMDGNHLIADTLYRAVRAGARAPTMILTVPGSIEGFPVQGGDSIGYIGIEVSDASPRGLRQSRRDRERIVLLADSLDLALVASSNNHGWGRTAAAWTLLRVPGWRTMSPQRLGDAIEDRLHSARRTATRVVERRVPYHGESALALAATGPTVAWQMFGALGRAERVAWIAYAWAIALLMAPVVGRDRRRVLAPARRAPAAADLPERPA